MSDTIRCGECGKDFDPADLTQVLFHEKHQPVVELGIRGVRMEGPRPWQAIRHSWAECGILDEAGRIVATLVVREEDGEEDISERAWPEALRIVRAVNSHQQLCDQLTEMMAAHQRADPHPPGSCTNCTGALAALAKARPEGAE